MSGDLLSLRKFRTKNFFLFDKFKIQKQKGVLVAGVVACLIMTASEDVNSRAERYILVHYNFSFWVYCTFNVSTEK